MRRPTARLGSPSRARAGGNGHRATPLGARSEGSRLVEAAEEPTPRPAPAPTRASPLVLLVEDHDDNRAMYRCYLEWEGFRRRSS